MSQLSAAAAILCLMLLLHAAKVIIEKSQAEVSLMEQETIEMFLSLYDFKEKNMFLIS